jgi:hypothetical protein
LVPIRRNWAVPGPGAFQLHQAVRCRLSPGKRGSHGSTPAELSWMRKLSGAPVSTVRFAKRSLGGGGVPE